MLKTSPKTEKRIKRQKAQAIVLIAVSFSTLCTFLALAVDVGRLYTDRRDLQTSVDLSSLSAGDTYQNTRDYVTSETKALNEFALNQKIYASATCSPTYENPPAGGTQTFACTYSGYPSYSLGLSVTNNGAGGSIFYMSATHALPLTLMGALTGSQAATIGVQAAVLVGNQDFTPALGAVSQAGCGGNPGNAIDMSGNGTINIIGNVVSDGSVNITSASTTVVVAGNVVDQCPSPPPSQIQYYCYPSGAVPPCVYPDVLGQGVSGGVNFPDPNYSPPPLNASVQANPSTTVILQPGKYSSDPHFTGGASCYFLSAGVYDWSSGYTSNGGFVSNELKPPAEPLWDTTNNWMDYTQKSGTQFWDSNGTGCSGDFSVAAAATGAPFSPEATYGVIITAGRFDTYKGNTYKRESSPSMCKSVTTDSSKGIQVAVSNVPGATWYNVYLSPTGCPVAGAYVNTLFGYALSFNTTFPQSNSRLSTCPYLPAIPASAGSGKDTNCTLGYQISPIIDQNSILSSSRPVVFAITGIRCTDIATSAAPLSTACDPPNGELAPVGPTYPNAVAARSTPPAGDRQGENRCSTVTPALISCPASITPGAVVFYLPGASACYSLQAGGDVYTFSGYQYNWVSIYEPNSTHPPANTCGNSITGHTNTAMIGVVYTSAASWSIAGGSSYQAPIAGGVITATVSIGGNGGIDINHNNDYTPLPPASKLIQ